jgi:hypothetical protein
MEYGRANGAVDINNKIRDNMLNFHDVMRSSEYGLDF